MMDFVRKNLVSLLIVGATVVLAGIAIFTAVRLYQLRQQSVAPTAPESQPGAQQQVTVDSCEILTFTLGVEEPVPGCYESCTLGGTDCPSGLECQTVSGQDICVNPDCAEDSDCTCDIAEQTYSCNSTCSDDSNCQTADSSYICYDSGAGKFCRLSENLTSETCTPTAGYSCNSTCTSDSDCTGVNPDYVCYDTGSGNRCRMESNPTSTTCQAPVGGVATPTPVPGVATPAPELPEAGVATPTIIGAGFGILLIIGALVLAL